MAEATTKVVTDLEKRELLAERVFNAPRELVFKAWSEPEALMQWWGPREWPLTVCNLDFRPGGIWHYCMTGPKGEEAWGRGVFSEIVPPERIVYSDSFSDAEGKVAENMPTMIISVDFISEGAKTRVRSLAQFASAQELQSVLDMGVVEGLTETWDRLEEYLARAK